MNYSEEIFKMLDVKPYEEFEIKNRMYIFRLTDNLILQKKLLNGIWIKTNETLGDISLRDILSGNFEIKKNIVFTDKEKLAIDYAKACGYKWIAKEKEGTVLMFDKKPIRGERHWFKNNYKDKANIVELPISFIKWEDEPYYIGN